MKIAFTAVFALVAAVMAAPSVENVGAAEGLVEKRCLGAGGESLFLLLEIPRETCRQASITGQFDIFGG